MKCCIVGCGAAGIIASKHLKAEGIEYDAFEMTDDVGGTWIYREETEDRYGTPVHSAMSKNLRTNLPKDIMEYEGFKYDMDKSFITWQEVLQYMHNFVNKFDLINNIKLGHMVTKISRTDNSWEVITINLETKKTITCSYDAVFICNGHFSLPSMPKVDGIECFQGTQIHSKYYRRPDKFKNKIILVIGYGPSGQEITDDVSKEAKQVFLSHHSQQFKQEYFKESVSSKPDVKKINSNSVTFMDGTTEDIDVIIYCTGYRYSFPFLDESCGITVDDNYIKPLFHQFINITHPTMVFIGIPFKSFLFPLFEMQVKAFIQILQNRSNLPSQENMRKELQEFENSKIKEGLPKRMFHRLSNPQEYIRQIRSVGNLSDLPQVLYDIYNFNHQIRLKRYPEYRQYVYRVINDNEFCYYTSITPNMNKC